ncbi:MAG TPA: sulfatase [Candidatus Limnocylindria bacterium]|nr:sulfatase [Candidatus Limnocylindria bacterium]
MRAVRILRLALPPLAALAGCSPTPPAPRQEYRVVRRLLDDGFRTAVPPLTHRGVETIADTRRLVVTAATEVEPAIVCPPPAAGPKRLCRVSVPRDLPVQTLIAETQPLPLLRATAKPGQPRRLNGRIDLDRRRRFVLRRRAERGAWGPRRLPYWMAAGLRAWPVHSAGAWDVTSRRIAIPPDAALTFAVGIQEPAWYVDSAPVQFIIEARGPEGDVEVYRRALDPARHPEDRRWFDERISLRAVGGRTVALRFKVQPLVAGDRRPQLPVWADPTLLAPAPPTPPSPPSIVLVSLDTLRARSMSVYGAERDTTPWFARFATSATRFTQAFTTFSNTYGAHLSMLTGTYPRRHDIRRSRRLAADVPTLAERLRAAGYDTAAFTEDAMLDGNAGFARGFATYWENTEIGSGAGDAPGTFARTLAWVAAHRDQPFFVFAHTYAVHAPYLPSPPYDKMFLESPTGEVAPEDQVGRLAYEQEVRQLDDDVARLVAGLDALVAPERVVLVITADHGEEFWEHQGLVHSQLYEEVLHVPLFVRATGRFPAGRTVDELVSLVDVTPTLLELAGLAASGLDGLSLVPLLDGSAATLGREMVFAESPPTTFSRHAWNFVARRRGGKCFSYELASLDRCFDLTRDPNEQAPLSTDADPALWQAARLHGESVFAARAEARESAAAPDATVDPEREEKLRALGYIE